VGTLALALLLGAYTTGQVTEVPTRLIPFTEDGPTRGPLPPSAAGFTLSQDDFNVLRLEHAKRAHVDDGLFAFGPKDPEKATALSAEATLLSVLFPPALAVAPSLGQAYAGNWTQVVLTSTVRTAMLTWIAIASIDFANQANTAQTLPQVESAATSLDIALFVGGGTIFILSMVDILTAGIAAAHANRVWEESVLGSSAPSAPANR
jgi:hypothetical protein